MIRIFLLIFFILASTSSAYGERILLGGSGVSIEPISIGNTQSFIFRGLQDKGYSYRERGAENQLEFILPHVVLTSNVQMPLARKNVVSQVEVHRNGNDAVVVFSFSSKEMLRPQIREHLDGLEVTFENESVRAQYVATKQPTNTFALATWKNEVTERPLGRYREGIKTASPMDSPVESSKEVTLQEQESPRAKLLEEGLTKKPSGKPEKLKEELPDAPGVFRKKEEEHGRKTLPVFLQEGKLPFRLSVDVLYLESNKESMLTLTNTSDSPLTLGSVIKEIVSPGTKEEHRRLSQDLKMYPRETTLGPHASQEVLILFRGASGTTEKVLEVSFLPKDSLAQGGTVIPKVGAALLALVQPRPRNAKVRWERDSEVLSFINEGNISAYFHSGTYCMAQEDCYTIPAFRIYPGRSVGIPVSGEHEVRITEELETASHEFTLPPFS